jgi:hypothetical protein
MIGTVHRMFVDDRGLTASRMDKALDHLEKLVDNTKVRLPFQIIADAADQA